MNFLKDKSIFITGGTGSLGRLLVEYLVKQDLVRKITVFSRDEFKQWELENNFPSAKLVCKLGDVRDYDRVVECMTGHDFVIHAAALKQVPRGETNPSEFIKTNVMGTQNVLKAASMYAVNKLVFISSDKAVLPGSNYGSSKLSGERLVINSALEDTKTTILSVVRFGNLMGARGTVVPYFLSKRKGDFLTVTDPESTRFHISGEKAVQSILFALEHAKGGEVVVPKLPSFRLRDLVQAIHPEREVQVVGLRKGEKLHETLMSGRESSTAVELEAYYVVMPALSEVKREEYLNYYKRPFLTRTLHYTSDSTETLSIEELQREIRACKKQRIFSGGL